VPGNRIPLEINVRNGQRMLLSDAGQVLVMDVRQGLRLLAEAIDNARTRPRSTGTARTLAVSVLPSLAARWLVPRLSRFQSGHPEVDIAIHPNASLAALDATASTWAIRYGLRRWHGLHSAPLMKSFLFPVCSRELLARTRLETPGELLKTTLLRNPRQKWRPWLLAAGLDVPEPTHGPVFNDAGLLLQAATAGQGVALARAALAGDDLAAGRLVRLFDVEIEDDYSWFVVYRGAPCPELEDR
jgi:LysR family transcriptional regulator, glycine cleavage system transcriptional activator